MVVHHHGQRVTERLPCAIQISPYTVDVGGCRRCAALDGQCGLRQAAGDGLPVGIAIVGCVFHAEVIKSEAVSWPAVPRTDLQDLIRMVDGDQLKLDGCTQQFGQRHFASQHLFRLPGSVSDAGLAGVRSDCSPTAIARGPNLQIGAVTRHDRIG